MTRALLLALACTLGCGQTKATHDGSADDGSVGDAGVVSLVFEEITLPNTPVALTNIVRVPGAASEFLVLEKTGTIHHYTVAGTMATHVGSVTMPNVESSSDCGLISAAFDPDYATNHFLFVGSCISPTHSRITRHEFDPSDLPRFATSLVTILTVGDPLAPEPWHNVGSIGFEPSGVMWALFGEKAVDENAQDFSTELGAIVRIVPSRVPGVGGSSPAPDNPFALDADPMTNANVAAKGLRSPWKGARDPEGRIFIGDVGLLTTEEVNLFVPSATTPNFAWPIAEGPCTSGCPSGFVQPIRDWSRSQDHPFTLADPMSPDTTRRVVWVGSVYTPVIEDRYEGALAGTLLYGDFCAGYVRGLTLDDANALRTDVMLGHLVGVTGMVQGSDDYLYVTTYGSCHAFPYLPGKLFRVRLAVTP